MNRFVGAGVVFFLLVVLQVVLPDAFVPVVALLLLLAPSINWRAWWVLRAKMHLDDVTRGELEPILSLRAAVSAAFYLAVGSTVTAALGLFVAARALGLVNAIPREAFLLLLSYPPLLATGPAIDWLRTVGRLEKR